MRKGIKDISGERFGRLVAVSFAYRKNNSTFWKCICDCGTEIVARASSLRGGNKKSCGCLRTELNREMAKENVVHGLSNTRIEIIHTSMKQRCYNPKNANYQNYGGRGIEVFEGWKHLKSFAEWAFKNGYDENLTLERIDVDGNYEPSNCTWIPRREQYLNKRMSRKNTSGYSGVQVSKNGKFYATIKINGKANYLGTFDTFMEAFEIRRSKELEFYGKYLYPYPNMEEIKEQYKDNPIRFCKE